MLAKLESIDDEIRELTSRLLSLKRCRNELVPFSALPTEIVLKIFSMVVIQAHYHADTGDQEPWYVVSHVCYSWRSIALADAQLWSHIDCRRPNENYISEMLARSVPVFLKIKVSIGWKSSEALQQLQDLFVANMARIEEVSIQLGPYSFMDYVQLRFDREGTGAESNAAQLSRLKLVKDDILNNLRRLILNLPSFTWEMNDSIAYSSLTHLTVKCHGVDGTCRDILVVLKAMAPLLLRHLQVLPVDDHLGQVGGDALFLSL